MAAIGQSIKRREDPRLITGEARYMDDLKLSGLAYAAILRSAFGHAKIKSINTEKAKQMPGVIGVFTGEDFKETPAMPVAWQAGASRTMSIARACWQLTR